MLSYHWANTGLYMTTMIPSRTFTVLLVGFCQALCCPNGWTSHGSSCYHFSHDKEAWANAVTICQILGGHLVEIDDAAENQYLMSQAKLTGNDFWIGLDDLQEEGTWVWVNSQAPLTPESYTNWTKGQPDNYRNNENCVNLPIKYNYYWNDEQCYSTLNYICEKPTGDMEIIG